MAYKFEVEQKAQQLRLRVLIAVYILFVISAAIIGVSIRLQQIRNVQPTRPGAADVGTSGYTLASDPTYNPRNLHAFAYCDVVDTNGNSTGTYIPLSGTKFFFQQISKRDVGQIRAQPLSQLCSSVPTGCSLNGQTVAQCSSSLTSCTASDGIPGIICPAGEDQKISDSTGLATWPDTSVTLGDLRWDDNEVAVTVDTDSGPIDQGSVTYQSVTYNINKSTSVINSPNFTPDINSLLPFYRWQCQSGCTAGSACSVDGQSWSTNVCTFSGGQFNCPSNKYLVYTGAPPADDSSDDAFLYKKVSAFRDTTIPTRVHVGFGYDGIVDSTYPQITSTAPQDLVNFKGNLVKFRFTCMAQAITTTPPVTTTPPSTTTPPVTTTVPPTTVAGFSLSAHKTGPACVERVSPRNEAKFVITVTNNGTQDAVINKVDDALPQGFTYKAGSTVVNAAAVGDNYVTTSITGTSQLVSFVRPTGDGGPWTLTPGQSLVIELVAIAGPTATTGTNTNQVVVSPEGQNSIDNITFQFEVSQTCVPVTGIFDEPVYIIGISAIIIILGLYLMYNPKATEMFENFSARMDATGKRINKTAKKLKKKASIRSQFEKKMTHSLKEKNERSSKDREE